MKISELIKELEKNIEKHGDIDVLCVTPGCSASWEFAPPDNAVCAIYSAENGFLKYDGVTSDKFLFIGIHG